MAAILDFQNLTIETLAGLLVTIKLSHLQTRGSFWFKIVLLLFALMQFHSYLTHFQRNAIAQ